MRRLPISCFIIAKDEADRIGRTIESVQPWVNEVIVVDSGSTDDTMAVAIRAGARAISNAWPGFGQQKRFAEDQCTNDWLLNIDADEVVTPELCREIEALFANGSPPCVAYGMPVQLVYPGASKPRRWARDHWCIRLYDRRAVRFRASGRAQFGRDRQSSVRKTSGCPAPLFDALVQLAFHVAKRAHRKVVQGTLKSSVPMTAGHDRIVHCRRAKANGAAIVQADAPVVAGPPPWLRRSRIDQLNRHSVGDARRRPVREKRFDFPAKLRCDDFIGIDVQEPVVRALILGEALLLSEPRPRIADGASPCTSCHGHRVIGAAAVDNDDLVHPRLDRTRSSDRCDPLHLSR